VINLVNRRNRAVRIPNGADEPKRRELARRYCQQRELIDLPSCERHAREGGYSTPRAHRPDSNRVEVDLSKKRTAPPGGVGRTFTLLLSCQFPTKT
jgi:hypothetical protein